MTYIDKGAHISKCGRYRYLLWREWRGTHDPKNWNWWDYEDGKGDPVGQPKSCVFVMLNPSTADGNVDDPTIRRCVAFAKAWKYERLEVVNLFAYRATKPQELLGLHHSADPVGVDNQDHIERHTGRASAGIVIAAWGHHGAHLQQDETVRGWISRPLHALGFTAQGHPRHPLYMPASASPVRLSEKRQIYA